MRIAAITLLLFLCVTELEQRNHPKLNIFCSLPLRPHPPLTPETTRSMIQAAARKHKIPAAFVKSIVAAESNFNPAAISPKGAIGLMQLMPETAQQYGVDPMDPAENIDGGTRYLSALIRRYRKSHDWLRRTIAAYNAGPGVVDRYRGVPPYPETRNYVSRVMGYLRRFRAEG